MPDVLLQVEDLTMHYHTRAGQVAAVDGVSFTLREGESLGLVGESGSGKSSVALSLLRLLPENAQILRGSVRFRGVDLLSLSAEALRRHRWRNISMVFQAAMNALNPVYTVGAQISETIRTHLGLEQRAELRQRIGELFELVGLQPQLQDRYPHELSGGMRQRVVIAMALACHPDLIIADEPTTALDVIVQDGLLRRLRQLQERIGMSMIYISHDIAVIAEVSSQIGIMYAGKLVELAPASAIFYRPLHPYTRALLGAFPSIDGPRHELVTLNGEPPNLLNPPAGCRFHPRCPLATEICLREAPPLLAHAQEHLAACWHTNTSLALSSGNPVTAAHETAAHPGLQTPQDAGRL